MNKNHHKTRMFVHSSIEKTTVKPHLRSLDLHTRNYISKSCKEGEFQCESDGICITGYKVCNDYNDCSDHSDEKYCEDFGNNLQLFTTFLSFKF